jgi:Arylsulfotransferase (ASST)
MRTRASLFWNTVPVLFLFGLFAAGSTYGYYIHRSEIFPYRLLQEARSAYSALRAQSTREEPATFLAYVPATDQRPRAARIAAQQPDDWILVTGGPYEFLDECPQFGCLAWIVDRNGKVIHHWEADLQQLWRDADDHVVGSTGPARFEWLGTQLLKDGSLIVAFQNDRAFPVGAGLAKFDRDGKLVWRSTHRHVNHWFTLGPDGTIYAPGHASLDTPARIGDTRHEITCEHVKAQTDHVAVIDPNGRLRERIDVMDLLVANGYAGLVRLTKDECDPFHLNFVQYIDAQTASRLEGMDEGDLLISLRNVYTILIFSPRTRAIKWIQTGRSIEQHSPRFLPDGSLVVFDNTGGDERFGGSRIFRERIGQNGLAVVAPRRGVPLGGRFSSDYAGYIEVGPRGDRLLVSLTTMGEILEIDLATGEPLWRYRKVFAPAGYPGAARDERRAVSVEALGASYVDKQTFAPVFARN